MPTRLAEPVKRFSPNGAGGPGSAHAYPVDLCGRWANVLINPLANIRRYARVPGLSTPRLALTACTHRTRGEALARHIGCGGAPPSSHDGGEDLARAASKPRAGDQRPAPGHFHCAASRLVPHVVRQRTSRRTGLRHGATPRLSGAAHQQAQRTRGPGQRARDLGVDGTASAARPLAKAATVTGRNGLQDRRVVIRQQESRDRRDWDLPR